MIPLFDGHCDTIWRLGKPGNTDELSRSTGHLDLERIEGVYGPYAQFFALYSNAAEPGPAMWDRFLQAKDLFLDQLSRNSDRIVQCCTAEQAQQAGRQGKAAAFLSVEGAELLECDLNRLQEAWGYGVRAVNITWNHANALSGSHKDHPEQGLTEQGKQFVRRMRQLGMLIDVSHLSDPGFWDIQEYAPGPVIATHSNARDVFFHTRNLTDAQITAIIKTRGVVGLNLFVNFLGVDPDIETVIAHLDHFWELGGEDTIALGGDWDGADPLARGFHDVTAWKHLHEELLRRNYPQALLDKLFYSNMMRIVSEVCSISVPEM